MFDVVLLAMLHCNLSKSTGNRRRFLVQQIPSEATKSCYSVVPLGQDQSIIAYVYIYYWNAHAD